MNKKIFIIIVIFILFPFLLFSQEGSMTQQAGSSSSSQAPVKPTTTEQNKIVQQNYKIYETEKMVYLPLNSIFKIDAQDQIAGVDYIEYSINEKGFVKYTEPIKFTVEGIYTLIYRAYDKLGNVIFSKTIVFCVDGSAPVIQLIPSSSIYEWRGLNYIPANYQFYFYGFDKYSGVKSIFYSINDGQFTEYKDPIKFDQGGSFVIKYYSIDNVGNFSDIYVYSFIVDNTAPSVKINVIGPNIKKDNKLIVTSQTKFSIEAFDKDSGVKIILVSIDGKEFLPYSGEINFASEGDHSIVVQAIDFVNNVSEMIEIKVVVDNTPPTVDHAITVGSNQ
ncbi:MAG: Ig-like domain-containing protein [Spirochaetes bacterium]|nr:Ig-like domain-containing protein [Spirochaetota bacterium]